MARRDDMNRWFVVLILIAAAIACWLNRWKYEGTQLRRNRFTGRVEERVKFEGLETQWTPIKDYEHGAKP